jgi:hypothetical protein
MRTALSTLLTFCPPAPLDLHVSILISSGAILISSFVDDFWHHFE